MFNKKSYLVDKWYFYKKDHHTAYYEKFFMDKVYIILYSIYNFYSYFQEVDKMRKKNSQGGK